MRLRARSGTYPHHLEAARLLRYNIDRGTQLGRIGENFARACDQFDRADAMLARLHNRAGHDHVVPEHAWPETSGPPILALARRDPETQTVILIMDATTANTAMFAITAQANERGAHIREVERSGQNLPEGSYGRRNRQALAAREARMASRLRAIEQAHRAAIERDAMPTPPDAPRTFRRPEHAHDREIELE